MSYAANLGERNRAIHAHYANELQPMDDLLPVDVTHVTNVDELSDVSALVMNLPDVLGELDSEAIKEVLKRRDPLRMPPLPALANRALLHSPYLRGAANTSFNAKKEQPAERYRREYQERVQKFITRAVGFSQIASIEAMAFDILGGIPANEAIVKMAIKTSATTSTAEIEQAEVVASISDGVNGDLDEFVTAQAKYVASRRLLLGQVKKTKNAARFLSDLASPVWRLKSISVTAEQAVSGLGLEQVYQPTYTSRVTVDLGGSAEFTISALDTREELYGITTHQVSCDENARQQRFNMRRTQRIIEELQGLISARAGTIQLTELASQR